MKPDSNLTNIPPSSPTKKSLYIKTFGCQMNEYDSQKLAKLLEDGYSMVETPEEANLILVNTCSVRDKPEKKLYSLLGEVRDLKLKNKDVMIGVGGCVAQQEGQNIIKKSKYVDFVFGTHNLSLVPSLINMRQSGAPPQVAINYRDEWEDLPLGLTDESRVSVFVSISRGCNKNCTYCIVPTTRGREVSRKMDEILKEVRIAVHRGAREIVLLGQTVNSYGLDFNPRVSFSNLLQSVSEIDGVQRIRFTSPHPQEIRKDFIDLVCTNPKISPHIHMPLQSGSDRILKLMNRNYRKDRYLNIISDLRSKVPHMGITTDIIVGFPGETVEDFSETLDVMDKVRYQNSYSFMFSPRPGTVASEIRDGLVPEEEKLRRLQVLQAKQDRLTTECLASYMNKTVEVLLDGYSKTNEKILQGRNPQCITVNLDKEDNKLKPGMTINALITKVNKFTLLGSCE